MTERTVPTALVPVVPDVDSAKFFAAAERGEFLLFRDAEGAVIAPQDACGTDDLTPFVASGRGRVVTSSVVYGKDADGAAVPRYTIGIVELDEGPWWWSEIVVSPSDADDAIVTGREVSVQFIRSGDEPDHVRIPVFFVD